jgi:hypothetical protein
LDVDGLLWVDEFSDIMPLYFDPSPLGSQRQLFLPIRDN